MHDGSDRVGVWCRYISPADYHAKSVDAFTKLQTKVCWFFFLGEFAFSKRVWFASLMRSL
jgi:hypothetical protein